MITSLLLSEYPNTKDCFELDKQIQGLKTDIGYFAEKGDTKNASAREALLKFRQSEFEVSDCHLQIEEKRKVDTNQIFDKYANVAQSRIVTDSLKTRNTLIVISGLALIASVALIIKINK